MINRIKKHIAIFFDFLKKLWKDPVWSKVIAAIIIFLGTAIWALINQYSVSDVYIKILKILNARIPVYLILSLFGIIYLIKLIIHFLKRKEDPIWSEKIGNYNFKELYSILQNQVLPVQTRGMKWADKKAPQEDLLTQFCVNKIFLNMGVTMDLPIEDGGYLYGVLCPKLMDYNLVEKIDYKDDRTNIDMIKYQATESGNKFFQLVEKVTFLRKEKT